MLSLRSDFTAVHLICSGVELGERPLLNPHRTKNGANEATAQLPARAGLPTAALHTPGRLYGACLALLLRADHVLSGHGEDCEDAF